MAGFSDDDGVGTTVHWDQTTNTLCAATGAIRSPSLASHEFDTTIEDAAEILLSDLEVTFAEIAATYSKEVNGEIALSMWADDTPDAVSSMYGLQVRSDEWYQSLDTFLYHSRQGLVLETGVSAPAVDDIETLVDLVGPLLQASGASVLESEYHKYGGYPYEGMPYMKAILKFARPVTIERATDVAKSVRQCLRYKGLSPGSPKGALALVLTGSPDALIGQPESQWLEVKKKGYGLEDLDQKHELGLDLASLANTPTGGILVVGLATSRDGSGEDVVSGVPGCTPGSLVASKYQNIARDRVVPAIEGLDVRVLEWHGRHILVAYVPPQSDYIQPFLVRGGLTAKGTVRSAAFTIPHRVGSHRWSTSAEAIHSMLVAARVALDRLPKTDEPAA